MKIHGKEKKSQVVRLKIKGIHLLKIGLIEEEEEEVVVEEVTRNCSVGCEESALSTRFVF